MDLREQYNNFSSEFSREHVKKNQINRKVMYEFIGETLKNKKVLDLACGDGTDANYYHEIGGTIYGIDASKELISIAQQKYPNVIFEVGYAEELPHKDNYFDCVFSKYAIMTSNDMKPIFSEMYRVLKPGGLLVYLVTHPFRQFFERKNLADDYFEQTTVDSLILGSTILVKEPTHTMNDYLNKTFLSQFELIDYLEVFDPAAEQIYGAKYPGFFVLKAMKKDRNQKD